MQVPNSKYVNVNSMQLMSQLEIFIQLSAVFYYLFILGLMGLAFTV